MKTRQGFNYCYPLKQLSPLDIFPAPRSETEPENRAEAEQEYLNLFDQFQRALSRLFHKNEVLLQIS